MLTARMTKFQPWKNKSGRSDLPQDYPVIYYMALSQKDWKLPNSRIRLAELDIDCGLDFLV